MIHIFIMTALGLIAGMIAGFWTRIIKENMIFGSIGAWLEKQNNRHLIETTHNNPLIFLVRCIFCFSVWVCFVLDVVYIIDQSPAFIYALIGVFGSLGAGNFIAELICASRSEG